MRQNSSVAKPYQATSERTLEVVLCLGITLLVGAICRFQSDLMNWGIFGALFCLVVCVQGWASKRNYVAHVPWLVCASIINPTLATVMVCAYAVLLPITTGVGVYRLGPLIIGELISLGLTMMVVRWLPPELWFTLAVAYLSVRSLASVLVARLSGYPLDIGAMSGRWALPLACVNVAIGISLFYFARGEMSPQFYLQIFAASLIWLFLLRAYSKASDDFQSGISGLGNLLHYAHPYTGGHSRRVAYLARETGRRLGLPEWRLDAVVQASLLHDIGKIAVDERILEKPGKLTDEEFATIKRHPAIGEAIIQPISEFKNQAFWIRHHHERIDGLGYPDGLNSTKIPIESRLIAVLDAYDAMTGTSADGHRRLYRDPVSKEAALKEIQRCTGTQFCPTVVKAFLQVATERESNQVSEITQVKGDLR